MIAIKGTKWCAFLATLVVAVSSDNRCNLRTTNSGTICVCNSTYCDTVPTLANLSSGEYQLYETSKTNLGFWSTIGSFSNHSQSAEITVTISNISRTHQTIIGFGGAFTDATGINIRNLSTDAQELLLQSYFGDDGLQYSIGRIPIGGTDFSTKGYTYCDKEDNTLDSFALQPEDFNYKIPFVQRAINLRGRDNIKFLASAWSAPIWMRTKDTYNGFGRLQDDSFGLWAQYYLKFFDAYKENKITFWGVTTQNEPIDGIIGMKVPSNGFTATTMKKWIKEFLGPAIRNSTHSDLKIILHDDQRALLPILKSEVLSDSEVIQYADGVAVHFYTDFFIPASFLNMISSDEKELFRLATEACTGSLFYQKPVDLGSWTRAETYLSSIMDDLSYDVVGWIDWNMALSETGGPNWINNEVDSPIIVNKTADEFYKQPMFYAIGHFSKFIVPNSIRIDTETIGSGVTSLAFVRPDGKIVVTLRNKSDEKKQVKINIMDSTEIITLDANSINTLLYFI